MHVVALRHAPLETIGSIGDALARRNIGCRALDLYAQPGAAPGLEDAAGLILMGGPMSANDDLPWIPLEIGAIREAAGRGLPVLGICLGAQLIARALGARVYRNPQKEIGWRPIEWTGAARSDPLFGGFAGAETVFQWHGETFDLPEGAELLAQSTACRHQAFRAGANVWGLQFHLEVTPDIVAGWLREDALCGNRREAAAPIDPHAHSSRLAVVAGTVLDRWCALLR